MMPNIGRSPLYSGLGQWALGLVVCYIAWLASDIYSANKTISILIISLAPFAFAVFFFRGMRRIEQFFAWRKTLQKARELHLQPSLCHFAGGFLVLDEGKNIFVCNGVVCNLADIKLIHCRHGDLAYGLDLFTQNIDENTDLKKVARPITKLGVKTEQELHKLCDFFEAKTQARIVHTDLLAE